MKNNITNIVKKHLCCSCGLCSAICPKKAIKYEIDKLGFPIPLVNENCINCKICITYCPGGNNLKKTIAISESWLYGFSTDKETRMNSSSGGILTELLCALINNNIVEYVSLVTNYEKSNLPRIILTNNINEIRKYKTSKYCPVEFGDIINQIKNINGRIAIVGLPCQINALKEYCKKNKAVSSKIVYYFSLFCNHVPSYRAIHYLASNVGVKEWNKVLFRGDGWPGFFRFYKGSEEVARIPYRKGMYSGVGKYFKNIRCNFCNDPFGTSADASFGDAYFCTQDKFGSTLIICRSQMLLSLFKRFNGDLWSINEVENMDAIRPFYKKMFLRNESTEVFNFYLSRYYKSYKCNSDICKSTFISHVKILKQVFVSHLGRYGLLWKYLYKIN